MASVKAAVSADLAISRVPPIDEPEMNFQNPQLDKMQKVMREVTAGLLELCATVAKHYETEPANESWINISYFSELITSAPADLSPFGVDLRQLRLRQSYATRSSAICLQHAFTMHFAL